MSKYLLGKKLVMGESEKILTVDVDLTTNVLVRGKVQDKDIYLVSLTEHTYVHKHLLKKFGSPNRHLKLEWGKFSGDAYEFLVKEEDLEEENER